MASTPPARPRSGLGSSRRRTPGTSGRHPSSGTASVGSAGATDPVTDTRLAAPPRSPYDRYLISAKPIRMPKLIPSDPLAGASAVAPFTPAVQLGGHMPRRRASPKVEGGRSKVAQAAPAAGNYDGGNDFPVDDLPPDDLPVRDIAEDQDEQHPAHSMAIRAADQLVVISLTLFMHQTRTVPSP